MLLYIFRRLLHMVPTLLISLTLLFIVTRIIPGDPAWLIAGAEMGTEEQVEVIRSRLGLDRPLIVQYFEWLARFLLLDFGKSFFLNEPVSALVLPPLRVTLNLVGLTMLLTLLISIPLGVIAASRQNTPYDVAVMVSSTLGMSLPSFWVGFVLMVFFGVTLRLLPTTGYRPLVQYGFVEWLRYLILPAVSLSLAQIALLVRTTRTSMLEVLRQDFILVARAKGLSNGEVLGRHALRNSLVPVVTVSGLIFSVCVGGALIVETVFAVPGLGRLTILAAIRRDYPLLQGSVFVILLVVLAVNLLVDISYEFLDPRLRAQRLRRK